MSSQSESTTHEVVGMVVVVLVTTTWALADSALVATPIATARTNRVT